MEIRPTNNTLIGLDGEGEGGSRLLPLWPATRSAGAHGLIVNGASNWYLSVPLRVPRPDGRRWLLFGCHGQGALPLAAPALCGFPLTPNIRRRQWLLARIVSLPRSHREGSPCSVEADRSNPRHQQVYKAPRRVGHTPGHPSWPCGAGWDQPHQQGLAVSTRAGSPEPALVVGVVTRVALPPLRTVHRHSRPQRPVLRPIARKPAVQ